MAMSAFKSSSKRGVSTTPSSNTGLSISGKDCRPGDDSTKKSNMRRSRSVSAFSRSSLADVSSDFSNSRVNPLFWSNVSPPSDEVNIECNKMSTGISAGSAQSAGSGGVGITRGRSASRNSEFGNKFSGNRKAGRSLSRIGIERRDRSMSRYPVSSNSEIEAERNSRYVPKSHDRKSPISINLGQGELELVRSSSDILQQSRGLRSRSNEPSPFDLSDNCDASVSCNLEDRLSTTSSLSEAEEKTIKAVCQQMKSVKGEQFQGDTSSSDIYDLIKYEVRRAIQDIHNDLVNTTQSGHNAIASSDLDISLELMNSGAVELMDLRSEYVKKLEQSQERARRLRTDLAVEEHRGLELSRILQEVIPTPKKSARRKASIERRKMSKRLTDDALTYFDECVSLSTFDGSDFSSLEVEEAPPIHQVSSATQLREGTPQPQDLTTGTSSLIIDYDNLRRSTYISSDMIIEDHMNPSIPDKISQFSFTNKPNERFGTQEGIEKYIRHCEKESKGSENISRIKYGDMGCINNVQETTESLLFDRLLFRNRIESGTLLLCGHTSATSSSYFGSII